jgi:hypothetical protein
MRTEGAGAPGGFWDCWVGARLIELDGRTWQVIGGELPETFRDGRWVYWCAARAADSSEIVLGTAPTPPLTADASEILPVLSAMVAGWVRI